MQILMQNRALSFEFFSLSPALFSGTENGRKAHYFVKRFFLIFIKFANKFLISLRSFNNTISYSFTKYAAHQSHLIYSVPSLKSLSI